MKEIPLENRLFCSFIGFCVGLLITTIFIPNNMSNNISFIEIVGYFSVGFLIIFASIFYFWCMGLIFDIKEFIENDIIKNKNDKYK